MDKSLWIEIQANWGTLLGKIPSPMAVWTKVQCNLYLGFLLYLKGR